MNNKPDIRSIQRIIGPATEEQIRFVDSFIFEDIGIFLPVSGPCYYALTPEHMHPSYMILYSFIGEGDGWINGIKKTSLKPGEILFIPPDTKHQENERSDTPRYLAMGIMPNLFESIIEEYKLPLENIRTSVKTAKAQKQFLPLCWQFLAEVKTLYQTNNSLLKAISVQLCHTIIRSVFDMPGQNHSNEWPTEIGQSIAFIHSHLHDKISLEDIARASHMSIPNFCRIFKKVMGKTPIEYLTSQRLHKAHNMLLANEFSIYDIAVSCGFSSISYFSTSFKKRYKISPEKYKIQMKIC